MSDHIEVSRKSFIGRIRDSIGGAVIGVILLLVGTGGLFWNEGRAVKRYKDLKEGAGAVVSVPSSDQVDPVVEGKLVHLTGETKTASPLTDPDFGVSVSGLKLIRSVEMYQWVEKTHTEKKEKLGGGTETVKRYNYEKKWRTDRVDSSQFKNSAGHNNPGMKYGSSTLLAEEVAFGAFSLPAFLVKRIGGAKPLAVESLDQASEEVRAGSRLHDGGVYVGDDPATPAIGDLRVRFSSVLNGPISVIAQQSGTTFRPYQTATGGTIELVETGTVDAQGMFQRAHQRNNLLTWAIRLGGFVLLGTAFSMILGPIAAFSSIVPFLGRIAGTGVAIVGFLLGGILSFLTVGVAWIYYRPALGIAVFVLAAVLLVFLVRTIRRRSAVPTRVPPMPEAPPPLV